MPHKTCGDGAKQPIVRCHTYHKPNCQRATRVDETQGSADLTCQIDRGQTPGLDADKGLNRSPVHLALEGRLLPVRRKLTCEARQANYIGVVFRVNCPKGFFPRKLLSLGRFPLLRPLKLGDSASAAKTIISLTNPACKSAEKFSLTLRTGVHRRDCPPTELARFSLPSAIGGEEDFTFLRRKLADATGSSETRIGCTRTGHPISLSRARLHVRMDKIPWGSRGDENYLHSADLPEYQPLEGDSHRTEQVRAGRLDQPAGARFRQGPAQDPSGEAIARLQLGDPSAAGDCRSSGRRRSSLGRCSAPGPTWSASAWPTELQNLQDNVPADPPQVVRKLIEQELGQPIDELFAEFDGRRHRLGVDRPGPRGAAEDRRAGGAQGAARRHRAEGGSRHGHPFRAGATGGAFPRVPELPPAGDRRRVPADDPPRAGFPPRAAEHAAVLPRFRRRPDGPHSAALPGASSTAACSAMERVEGIKLSDTAGLTAAGIDLEEVARRGAHLYLEMIFGNGFYHADPHPGNVVLMAGGVIGLLDFGMVGRLDERLQEDIERDAPGRGEPRRRAPDLDHRPRGRRAGGIGPGGVERRRGRFHLPLRQPVAGGFRPQRGPAGDDRDHPPLPHQPARADHHADQGAGEPGRDRPAVEPAIQSRWTPCGRTAPRCSCGGSLRGERSASCGGSTPRSSTWSRCFPRGHAISWSRSRAASSTSTSTTAAWSHR